MKKILQPLIMFCLVMFFYGCSIPKSTHSSAEYLDLRIKKYKEAVVEQKGKLSEIIKENDFLSRSEDQIAAWDLSYVRLDNRINSVASAYNRQVVPLLEENKRKNDNKVKAILQALSSEIALTIKPLPVPVMEAQTIIEVYSSTDKWLSTTKNLLEGCERHSERLDTAATQLSHMYPNRTNDINKLVADTKVPKLKANQLRQKSVDELAKPTPEINWAIVANCFEDSLEQGNIFLSKNEQAISDIQDLDLSYTKILEDMRVDYFVQIFRSSWDNGSDANTTKNTSYPMKKVSREQFEYMVSAQYPLASVYYSWGDWKIKGYTQLDQIISTRASWPSKYHDYAEYWVEDSERTYWHKYTVIQNGKETKTDWIEVDEEEYVDFSGALGMSIASKPYGSFPSEEISEPHPPAFAFVDNPKYGEWKTDDQGNKFWDFYTDYMMLNLLLNNNYGGYRYYDNDYRSWRSGGYSNPYYGRSATSFGTKSPQVQNSSRYRSSNYARSGSFKNPPTAIRGSGPSRRGGGPSGGGK